MIYPTFEEWWESPNGSNTQLFEQDRRVARVGWNARDAEIADLKRQLRQALAQVEIVDRALGDPGNTSSKVALDAYVQDTVDRERNEIAAKLDLVADGYKTGGYSHRAQMLHALAGEIRAKVKP